MFVGVYQQRTYHLVSTQGKVIIVHIYPGQTSNNSTLADCDLKGIQTYTCWQLISILKAF